VAQEQRDPYPHCDVCGRTILKGEETHEYVTPQGQRLEVCVLCRSHAEASGWTPGERAGELIQAPAGRGRPGEALRKRLGQAAARARAGVRPRSRADRRNGDAADERSKQAKGSAGPQPPAASEEPRADGAKDFGAQQAPKRTRAQTTRPPKSEPAGEAAPEQPRPRRGPEALVRRGVQRFNGSDATRKVAGLIRSLGEPRAAVRGDASRQLALVTVAWELSWYQWEVAADGDGVPVREVAKGDEVGELAEDERTWNASVAQDGKLRLKSASARRKSSAKSA
jgi:hypothetical protein